MVPLKVTTEYSLLKSLIKIDDLINFLKKNNITSCGICDDELFGCMEFYLKCKENNIKPIIGLDIIINDYHIYIYAKNYNGYLKLLKINTKKYNSELIYNDLIDNNILIIIPYSSIDIYDNFKNNNNIYLGYNKQSEKQNELLLSSNIIYLNNIRCLNKEDIKYLEYLKLLGSNFIYTKDDYFKIINDKEIEKETEDFANLINIDIPFNNRYIPRYKENIDSNTYLYNLALKGLTKRLNGNITNEYKERLDNEFQIIKDMGFIDYFLIVYDYVFFAKTHEILVGPGRGSAAGSLISYAIGITNIDPVKYDLLFSRFLNPSRVKMPDIDIDFEDSKRHLVIDYIRNRYGSKKVALGLTFSTLKSKLVLISLGKVLKIEDSLLSKFVKNIESDLSLKDNLKNNNIKKYLELYKELNNLYDIAMHLENLKKNVSTHAAGVVICSKDLDEVVPVYIEDNLVRTGIEMQYLEKMGLLKMDFLGLRNLSLIGNITSKINDFKIDHISLEDKKTYKIFEEALTDDIFQFKSNYAKNNLLKLKVSNFNELVNAVALVRPGPADQIDEYVKNKNNPNLVIDENIKDILSDTYGIIIYQEQVMSICKKVASFTSEEADNIRIAMSKKKEDILKKEKNHFVDGAINNGYSKDYAIDLFDKLYKFSSYGFNKAHSVAYALITYQMAYLQANYPCEFYLAMLDDNKDIVSKKRLLNILKKENIKILKPNINVSTNEYQIKNKYLLLPLSMIKGIGEDLVKQINKYKYDDIFDFVIKTKDFINEKIYDILVRAGVFNAFNENIRTLIENKDVIYNYASLGDSSLEKPLLEKYQEYDNNTLRNYELELYGFYIGNHPSSLYSKEFKISTIKDNLFKNVNIHVLVEKITRIKTKNGEDMAFVIVSDETGEIEITLFPEVYKMLSDIRFNDFIYITGKTSRRFDKYQIIVNNIERK